ncbi:MAG: TolC family protein [Holophagaceae bacterium]|nr:TolC family protein [Holophagaceae bacterium]
MAFTRAIPSMLVCYGLVAGAPADAPKRISLQEAIQTSLENNLQVQVAREVREATRANVLVNSGSFDWNLTGSLSVARTEDISLGVSKLFGFGGNLSVNYKPSYFSSRSTVEYNAAQAAATSVTPFPYDGNLSATFTQPLLKGFGRDTTESLLIVARKGAQQADLTFQKSIIDLVANTESLYWDVVYAQKNLDNKKAALALAQKQLKENQIRVQVGTLAPIEVTSAEASVALKEQEIIAAEAQWLNAKDALLRALYPTTERPSGLEPTDAPSIKAMDMEEAAAEKMALERRVELKNARLDVESKQVLETAARNRLKPQLDLSVGYSGASSSRDGYSGVQSDLLGSKYPGYNASLTFAVPVANRAARGSENQARANRRSSELSLRDLELGIVLEVRTALRTLDASEKGVKASEKTRIFREKNLEAEQKKFENGMSTNFFVLQRQDELDQARASELQAQIAYAKAVTSLEKSVGNLLEARKLELR